ncbi:phosphatidylglycerol lysyltransferase domain-containing protein [Maridesulfovibrio sp. FT414]|uniref:phosphatidylglycerol lysyltransferase domain-containing protein n=1 Tax=Maridesulfovibrio sp. FT414 TaxID=2979469 RepID=UPI003D803984
MGYCAWINARNIVSNDHAVILSNPVTSEHLQPIFIEKLASLLGKITLVQIDHSLATQLYRMGFKVYQLGIETELELASFNLSGKNRSSLRQWKNKALRSGITVEEKKLSEIPQEEISLVSDCWIQRKGGREMSFLTRPLPDRDEDGVRFFWARMDGQLIGLAGFDPIYEHGRPVGYYHNFDRLKKEAVNGTSPYILLSAIEKFRSEKIERVSLGLSPLAGMNSEFNLSGILKKISELFYRYGEPVYPFKGNDRHKSKFGGNRKKTYVASNAGWFDTMIAAAIACGLEIRPAPVGS